MSNKLKKCIKNKIVPINVLWTSPYINMGRPLRIDCIITNDELGKTISIVTPHDGTYTIPFEQIEDYLK